MNLQISGKGRDKKALFFGLNIDEGMTAVGLLDGLNNNSPVNHGPKYIVNCLADFGNLDALPVRSYFQPVFIHQLQNSLCIHDADVLEKLCQQHIIGL
jgi:hypothetical protein